MNQTLANKDGIGVGLALTRELVEMHGGTIEARSSETGGSEFVVRLPLLRSRERLIPGERRASVVLRRRLAPHVHKRLFKVLVVDDNEATTRALSRLLELCGHDTVFAYTGSDALQKAAQFLPDVIFLDIGLPDIDGYEVAQLLRRDEKPYYLVALTGYGQREDKERARRAGFNYHLTKPAGLKEIETVLRRVPRMAKERYVRSR